jgi:anti-sigma regulatory factor (Ser/Thr protein kinase)
MGRGFVADILAESVPEAIRDAAEVMVSELATNAVRHAHTAFSMTVSLTDSRVRIEVSDGGSGLPSLLSPATTELSGRGLKIVDGLADEWGVEPSTRGKTVWFVLHLETQSGGVHR